MILELIFKPIFMLVDGLLSLLPEMPNVSNFVSSGIEWLSRGLIFFPAPLWVGCIGSIIFWSFGGIGWSFVEWVYKKLPGVS